MQKAPSRNRIYIAALGLLLLGAFFRFHGHDQRLHPDEALYADLSRRIGIWGDWQLAGVALDKPPLFFFVGGMFQRMLGDSEFTVRLPNAFASMLTLALVFTFTHRLTGKLTAAALCTLLLALSPMDIAHAVSGFIDSQLIMWLVMALTLLLYRRWGLSGLAFGIALGFKSTALWMLPLFLAVGMSTSTIRHCWRWICGAVCFPILITLWDWVASEGSFWRLARQHNGILRLIRSDEVLPRAENWLPLLGYVLPYPILLVGVVLAAAYLIRFHKTRRDAILWSLAGFTLAYLGIHWLVAVNIFDRYLMPITPLLVILVGTGISQIFMDTVRKIPLPERMTKVSKIRVLALSPLFVFSIVFLFGITPAWQAANGKSPIATDANIHQGIDTLAAVMNRDFAGEIFYEHWLGWELGYYLTADPKVLVLYFDTADDLAAYAEKELPTIPVPRYFVAPKKEAAPWIRTLEQRQLDIKLVYDDDRYVVYSLSE